MIKLTRVDYRLIHGQVAMSWTHALDVDCILCASDAVAKDDMRKAALRLARPNGVKLVIKDVNAAIEALNSGVTDKYSLFIIVETIEDAYRLAKGCKDIKEINLGGTRKSPETMLHPTPAIFATETDAEHIQELVNDGVVIESVRSPMTQRYLPRTFSSRKYAIVWHLLTRSSFLKPVDHLIGGLFIKEKSKKSEIALA